MARRDPRRRGGSLGLGTVALAAALAGAIPRPMSFAQPAPASDDIARARDLYRSAEAAMKDGRFDDAARDYGAAYELSKDPALLFKLGHAHERAGRCDVALTFYARYLRDGAPTQRFTELTRERIAACGSVPDPGDTADPGAPAGPASEPTAAGGAAPAEAGAGTTSSGGGAIPGLIPNTRQKVAWLMSGGALALVTLGGVLAYATGSSENDVRDLYAGPGGQVPTFNAQTKQRYDDLIDEGRRYQYLSWTAFGLAGAAAVGAAVLFTIGRGEEPPRHAQKPVVTPVVTTRSAGVAVRF